MKRIPVGQLLVESGFITQEQLEHALVYQKEHGSRIGEALRALKLCRETEIVRVLAEQDGLRFVDLEETPPTGQAVRLVPQDIAFEYSLIPVRLEGGRLLVAAGDPNDLRIDETLAKLTGLDIIVAAAAPTQLRKALQRYEEFLPENASADTFPAGAHDADRKLLALAEHARTVRALGGFLADAVRKEATEVFFELDGSALSVRAKILGMTEPLGEVPAAVGRAVIARLKLLAGLPLSPVAEPAQSRFLVRVGGENAEIRATFLPAEGEDTVVLKRSIAPPDVVPLQSLGLDDADLESILRIFGQRRGLVLVAGAAAGRNDTLHSIARHLSLEGLEVMLLERTLERRLSGVNHVVRPDGVKCTFAEMLEWCCLQSPDAIVVGELPTAEAVEVALRAAATGQLVIAGSWAADPAGAVQEVLNSHPDRHLLGSALSAVMAQQRVRRVCECCAKPYQLPFQLGQALRQALGGHEQNGYRRGSGCKACNYTGWKGTLGVFDVLLVDGALREALTGDASSDQIAEQIRSQGPGLEREVLTLAEQGVIRPEELIPLGMAVAATYSTLNAKAGPTRPVAVDSSTDPSPEESETELESWDALAGALSELS